MIVVGAAAAVLAVAVLAVWWFLLRSDAPDPVTLEGAVEAVTSTTVDTGAPTSDGPVTDPPGIEGEWRVRSDGTSFVGYRVNEELAGIGVTTAAGRTPLVEGRLLVEDGSVVAVEIEADLTGLESDDNRRDNAIRRQALETDTFPAAGFVLTGPIELPPGAADGAPISVAAAGELTVHGVTRPVEVPLEAQLVDESVVVTGSLPILFADYDISRPRAAIVLSVDDEGIMELQLVFDPVSG
jgi:polyisoprenoid-binding protein YceI